MAGALALKGLFSKVGFVLEIIRLLAGIKDKKKLEPLDLVTAWNTFKNSKVIKGNVDTD